MSKHIHLWSGVGKEAYCIGCLDPAPSSTDTSTKTEVGIHVENDVNLPTDRPFKELQAEKKAALRPVAEQAVQLILKAVDRPKTLLDDWEPIFVNGLIPTEFRDWVRNQAT